MIQPKIGFIGQGWIGRNYADDFETRGFAVVRYAKEEPYQNNLEQLKECDYFFVAVPTPTTPAGFDYSIVEAVLHIVPPGRIVIIKSTLLPGTTDKLQDQFKELKIVHSPEFLREKTAKEDASAPKRNLIGLPTLLADDYDLARKILSILPKAPYEAIMSAKEAELVKYAGNTFLYTKVLFFNLIYDLAIAEDMDYETVRQAVVADPRIGDSHTIPVDSAGGRGAGGHCFIKDFEALRIWHKAVLQDEAGASWLKRMAEKNNELLQLTNKDMELLKGVYGESVAVL